MTRPLVLYHANCLDGLTAAWIAWLHLGDEADYLPVYHGQPPPAVAGRDVYVLDFSYKRQVMLEMAKAAIGIVVLDHHKSAREEIGQWASDKAAYLRDSDAGMPMLYPGPPGCEVFCRFDMTKSGARLALEYFFPKQPGSWLVDYTEDRDLWRHSLPHTHEVHALLASLEPSFALWSDLSRYSGPGTPEFVQLVVEGAAILRYQKQLVERLCRDAREGGIGGHIVLAVNTPCLQSEVAGKLAEGRPFGACWYIRADGKIVWSLRSREGGIDVSEVAKQLGGGGHRNAAGFEEIPG